MVSFEMEDGTYGELMDVLEDTVPILRVGYHEAEELQSRKRRRVDEAEYHEAEVLRLKAAWCDG